MAFKGLISSANLIGSFPDSLVYRREIGMDNLGRLRPRNSIIPVHKSMLSLHALLLLIGAVFGLAWMAAAGLVVQVVLSLLAWPVAYRKAFLSMLHDRARGSLEQLWLTRLTAREIFEGKYHGTLAPFGEVRRHMPILTTIICTGVLFAAGPLTAVAAFALSLLLLNHFGLSCKLGIIGGIRAGAATTRLTRSMMTERECNPWAIHIFCLLQAALRSMIISIPVGLVLIPFLLTFSMLSGIPAIELFILLVLTLIPLIAAGPLMDYQRKVLDETTKNFRRMISFEAGI